MNYQEEKKYIGHKDQLMKVKKIRMEDGKASGVEMVDVQNRSGMHFDVNISRGMDIPYLDFCGENIGFISPCGVVAPEYFDAWISQKLYSRIHDNLWIKSCRGSM